MTTQRKLFLPAFGIDNISDDTVETRGYVQDAYDVVIDDTGRFRMREGYTTVDATASYHSIRYVNRLGKFVVCKDNLFGLLDDNGLFTQIASFPILRHMDYTEVNDRLYFSCTHATGYIDLVTAETNLIGVEPIQPVPTISVTSGSLHEGVYAVVFTRVNSEGEESAASEVLQIEVPENGGIRVSDVPIDSGNKLAVYVTSANGDVLRRAIQAPMVGASFTIGDKSAGPVVSTQFKKILPGGEFVRAVNGRVFVAKGSVLYFSDPMRPHLYDPRHNVIAFKDAIRFIESVDDGLYVADARGVWFLSGDDPEEFGQTLASEVVAAPYSSTTIQENFLSSAVFGEGSQMVAVWLTNSGYMYGLPNGTVVAPNEDRVYLKPAKGKTAVLRLGEDRVIITLAREAALASAF